MSENANLVENGILNTATVLNGPVPRDVAEARSILTELGVDVDGRHSLCAVWREGEGHVIYTRTSVSREYVDNLYTDVPGTDAEAYLMVRLVSQSQQVRPGKTCVVDFSALADVYAAASAPRTPEERAAAAKLAKQRSTALPLVRFLRLRGNEEPEAILAELKLVGIDVGGGDDTAAIAWIKQALAKLEASE